MSLPLGIESREVLADAYANGRRPQRMLVHYVLVDKAGQAYERLCKQVALDSLADRCASDPQALATCRHCLAALRRRQAPRSSEQLADDEYFRTGARHPGQ